MNSMKETIKIDNKEYYLSELSDECKAQLESLQFCEQEIARLNNKLAVAQTARNAYRKRVGELLPDDEVKH